MRPFRPRSSDAQPASGLGNNQKGVEVIYRASKTTSDENKRRQAIIDAADDLVPELSGVIEIKKACFGS